MRLAAPTDGHAFPQRRFATSPRRIPRFRWRLVVAAIVLTSLPPSGTLSAQSTSQTESLSAIQVRGNLDTSRNAFLSQKHGTVAFMGGSITAMNGYRPMVMQSLTSRFPDTEFEFINAGISSTCSHTGAFRLRRDVLSKSPDLFIVEFAVNDDQDAHHDLKDAIRGMEGVLRAARTEAPDMDIIVVHFVNESMLATVQAGKVPLTIQAHERVAEHYGISTCNVANELAKRINFGSMTWEQYGGVHPKQPGNRVAADLVDQVLNAAWRPKRIAIGNEDRVLPEPIDRQSFDSGRFLTGDDVKLGDGWSYRVPDWKNIDGSLRQHFAERPMWIANQIGATAEIEFHGKAFGVYVLAGPDAGVVEYQVDRGPWKSADLYHHYSKGLHYPRTVVLEAELAPKTHRVKLRVSETKNTLSKGTAIRVVGFVAS